MSHLTILFSLLLLFIPGQVKTINAQTEIDEHALLHFDEGLGFHAPDTSFGLNLRFRIQNRLGLTSLAENPSDIKDVEVRIRRLRLCIDGYTINKRISYYLQLSFSRGDMDWDNTEIPNIIRDAIVYYNFSENFYVGFGQAKLPGNRQRINSSGQLQFTDRSIVNAQFNIDRDFGLMSYYSGNISGFHYNIKTAISSGKGRNAIASGDGLAYTARLEMLPLGRFINNGDFSEGDLEREPFPKFSFAGGYHFNHKATKTQGQRGKPLFEPSDLKTLFFDAVMKYRGWAAFAEYMELNSDNPVTFSPDDEIAHVFTGHGVNLQLSYVFMNNIELAGRYTFIQPARIHSDPMLLNSNLPIDISEIYEPVIDEYTLGVTKYLVNHKIKAQGNIGFRTTGNTPIASGSNGKWIIQFQVELGI